jgi:hypothetical protein
VAGGAFKLIINVLLMIEGYRLSNGLARRSGNHESSAHHKQKDQRKEVHFSHGRIPNSQLDWRINCKSFDSSGTRLGLKTASGRAYCAIAKRQQYNEELAFRTFPGQPCYRAREARSKSYTTT